MYPAWALHRNAQAAPNSSGRPIRPAAACPSDTLEFRRNSLPLERSSRGVDELLTGFLVGDPLTIWEVMFTMRPNRRCLIPPTTDLIIMIGGQHVACPIGQVGVFKENSLRSSEARKASTADNQSSYSKLSQSPGGGPQLLPVLRRGWSLQRKLLTSRAKLERR